MTYNFITRNSAISACLSVFTLMLSLGCGGGGEATGTGGESSGSGSATEVPTPGDLIGNWTLEAFGVDKGCGQGLICKIDYFRFTLSRGEFCSDGKYKFTAASNVTTFTMPAAQVRIERWPDCNRLNAHVSTRILMRDGDATWDPKTGVLSFSMATWEKELCPTSPRDSLDNVWWFGMPNGPMWAEGSATVNFLWNSSRRQFDFIDGDCLLATTGFVSEYFSGRGEFLYAEVSRFF